MANVCLMGQGSFFFLLSCRFAHSSQPLVQW
jgi:hypothetical protein